MIIRLKAFARFRDLLGGEMEVNLSGGTTVFELLNKLASRSSDLADQIFDTSGKVKEDVNVVVNGRHFESLNGPETVLEDGDDVAIFPAVVGG